MTPIRVGTRAVLLLAGLTVLLPAGPVLAHEVETGLSLRVAGVRPGVPGLSIEARDEIAPTLVVRNDTGERFEVLGSDGVPFLRVGPADVRANLASPDWWASERPDPAARPPTTARPGAAPEWVRIAAGSEWAWYEHRLGGAAARSGLAWSVPARVGERDVELTGTWERVDVLGTFRSRLTAVEPSADGLEVTVLPGSTPGLYVQNETGRPLEILGAGGAPFLRIGPDTIQLADPAGTYRRVASGESWGWVEPRAGWTEEEVPGDLLQATAPVRVGEWSVPARLAGEPVEIRGVLDWVPVGAHHPAEPAGPGNGGLVPFVVISAVAVVLVAILVPRIRARRGVS